MAATTQKSIFIEYGLRMSEGSRRGEFRIGNEKSLPDAIAEFERIAPMLESRTFGQPTFREMMELPEVAKFISYFKERKLHFEFAAKANSGRLQKAVIIADENFRPIAIVRWIEGQGGAFFYHGLSDKQSSVDEVLASVQS